MTDASPIEEFTGFTEQEVRQLCEQYNMPFSETKKWYDGYCVDGVSIYNPKSVVEAMLRGKFNNYWTKTETYEALKVYIDLNQDGLRDKIIQMIAGETVPVNPDKFQNDMTTFYSADDVLTLLVHLGYLTYDEQNRVVWIPNGEVRQEFINSIEDGGWTVPAARAAPTRCSSAAKYGARSSCSRYGVHAPRSITCMAISSEFSPIFPGFS